MVGKRGDGDTGVLKSRLATEGRPRRDSPALRLGPRCDSASLTFTAFHAPKSWPRRQKFLGVPFADRNILYVPE